MTGHLRLRLLHVDGDHANRLGTDDLQRLMGHETTAVCSGLEAVAALENGRFDAVLTDIHMLEMTGEECRQALADVV